jgi:hypothetical protein
MAAEAASAAQRAIVRESGGARALVDDTRVVFALANEARYRLLASVLGASREQANVATFVVALLIGHHLHEAWRRITRISGAVVDPVNDVLGVAVVREGLSSAAGPAIRDNPQLATLLLAVVVLRWRFPVAVKAMRGIRVGARRLDAGFRHRYGYLVDVGHMRARHYEARARKAMEARATR